MASNNTSGIGSTSGQDVAGIVSSIYISVIGLITIVYNLLIIVAFIRDARIRTPFNLYILNLTIIDLGIAVFNMPLFVIYSFLDVQLISRAFCTFFVYITWILPAAALNAVMWIAFDRLWALFFPLHYRQWKSNKMTFGVCSFMWIYLNGAILPYLVIEGTYYQLNPYTCFSSERPLRRYQFVVQVVLFDFPLVAVILSYAVIIGRLASRFKATHRVAVDRRNSTKVTETELRSEVNTGTQQNQTRRVGVQPAHARRGHSREVNAEKQEQKLYAALIWIAGALILLWTPGSVYFFKTSIYDGYFDMTFYTIVLCIEYTSCIVNPLIYHRSLPGVQRAIRELF